MAAAFNPTTTGFSGLPTAHFRSVNAVTDETGVQTGRLINDTVLAVVPCAPQVVNNVYPAMAPGWNAALVALLCALLLLIVLFTLLHYLLRRLYRHTHVHKVVSTSAPLTSVVTEQHHHHTSSNGTAAVIPVVTSSQQRETTFINEPGKTTKVQTYTEGHGGGDFLATAPVLPASTQQQSVGGPSLLGSGLAGNGNLGTNLESELKLLQHEHH